MNSPVILQPTAYDMPTQIVAVPFFQRGATLIELMVALVIMSVLFGLGAQSYSAWIQNQQIRTAAESVLNGLQITRSEAVKNNARGRFVLCALPAPSWEVLAASAPAPQPAASLACGAGSNAAAGEVRIQERSAQEGSRNVAAADQVNAGATTATFGGDGRLTTNADGSAALSQINFTNPTAGTCVAAGGAIRCLRVLLNVGGQARLCDPALVAANDPRGC